MPLSSPLQQAELEAQSSLHTNQDTPSHADATTNTFDTGTLQVGIQKMHLSPPNSPKRGIHKLPVEIVLKIIEFLPAEKAREFREVSGLWGAGGTTVFFPGGICKLRPHRRDTEHLHYLLTLKASQYFANRIENIKIYAGDMNMARWAYLIKRIEMERIPSKDDPYFDDLARTAMSEMYERWNTLQALDDRLSPRHCDFQLLRVAFEKLPKVKHLSIISLDFPLPSEWENEGTQSSDLIV